MLPDARARLDLGLGESDGKAPRLPLGAAHTDRGDQHAAAGEPSARIDDEVADRPLLVVEDERLDLADVAIARPDREAHEALGAAQHRCASPGMLAAICA